MRIVISLVVSPGCSASRTLHAARELFGEATGREIGALLQADFDAIEGVGGVLVESVEVDESRTIAAADNDEGNLKPCGAP